MSEKWIKKGRYYATNGSYTMSWNDAKPKRFTLYHALDFIESGTREECLDAFNKGKK